ncbi:hypothetical protein EMCRGX_G029894 [Ephydatia muelleri]
MWVSFHSSFVRRMLNVLHHARVLTQPDSTQPTHLLELLHTLNYVSAQPASTQLFWKTFCRVCHSGINTRLNRPAVPIVPNCYVRKLEERLNRNSPMRRL